MRVTPYAALLALLCTTACGGGPSTPLCRDGGGGRGAVLSAVSDGSARLTWPVAIGGTGAAEYREPGETWRPAPVTRTSESFEVTLNDLRAGTAYEYRLGATSGEELSASFRTAPAPGDGPVRFAVLGDSGGGCEPQYAVARRLVLEEPDFVLHTGDVLYSKNPADLDPFYFRPFADVLARAPFFVAIGNHDVDTVLLEAIELPRNDADGTERFYSFQWGNAHFVALDTNQSLREGSRQHEWLKRDLSQTTLPWRVVFLHHPPYSSSRTSYVAIRRALEPLLAEHRVDVVFSGHDHNYERTYPMRDDRPVAEHQDPRYVDPAGTVFVVTGGGGRSLYPNGTSNFTAYSESAYHVTTVEIEGQQLRLRAVRTDGSTLDQVTIDKAAAGR